MENLDSLDFAILELLIKDAKTPYTEIGKQLSVSSGTIHVRMKKMEKLGIVVGSRLIVDADKLGLQLTAFVQILTAQGVGRDSVVGGLEELPEVVAAYLTTGPFSILAKLVCRDIAHLREVITSGIEMINGVVRTETIISLDQRISRPFPISLA